MSDITCTGKISLYNIMDGEKGEKGDNGTTLYTWVKYADDNEGRGMSDLPEGKKYIGFAYNKNTPESSTTPTDYSWSLIKGEDGIRGETGADGKTYYTWVKYADDENGTDMTDDPTDKTYIGMAFNKESPTGSSEPSDYTWTRFRGVDGDTVRIELNFEEIVKFYDATSGEFSYSPGELTITAWINNEKIDLSPKAEYSIKASLKAKDSSKDLELIYNETERKRSLVINNDLFSAVGNEPAGIKIDLLEKENEAVIAQKWVGIQYGSSEDMAKLAIKANGIVQAVYGTNLEFNANGLILKSKGQEVFSADDDGNLTITGTINANKGYFGGDLHSISGTIGGLILSEGYMFANYDGYTENPDKNDIMEHSSLFIDGTTGQIVANSIVLGEGATLASHIQFGAAKIQNPEGETTPFIVAGEDELLRIYETGKAEFGDIVIDGPNSTIHGGNKSFIITPNYANFPNINCSGTIKTAVFEKDSIQSVGGSMIFRKSLQIKSLKVVGQKVELIFEGYEDGKDGEDGEDLAQIIYDNATLWFIDKDGKCKQDFVAILKGDSSNVVINNNILTINLGEKLDPVPDWSSVIVMGEEDELILGINTSTVKIIAPSNKKTILFGEGLTMNSQKRAKEDEPPFLFLGNLKNLDSTQLTGYGLYASNVHLTGSLITETSSNSSVSYAGINTLNGVTATIFPKDSSGASDTSPIIFWGGAVANTTGAIQEAKFQVTQNGSLYATQAYFKNSVFTDGIIRGASLYTAKIVGENGLVIQDTSGGISFQEADGKTTFQIKNDGLYGGKNPQCFLAIENGAPKKLSIGEIEAAKKIVVAGTGIIQTPKVEWGNAKQKFDSNSLTFEIDEKEQLSIGVGEVQINEKLILSSKMTYEPAGLGYDLYIAE